MSRLILALEGAGIIMGPTLLIMLVMSIDEALASRRSRKGAR